MNQKIKLPDGREVTIRVQNAESYVPNPQNTNKGKERGKAALDDSLQNSGFHRGIVVAKDGTVINGNHTYQSASELGVVKSWIEVEVEGDVGVVTKRIDWKNAEDPNAILAAIADNRTSALNLEFDPEILEQALQQLEEAGKDIPDTILTKEEIEQLLTASNEWMNDEQNEGLTDPDEIPDEEFTETRVKRGDIWQLGRHRVMCGDSTVITDVERLMNGEKAVLIHADPPYGMGKEKDGVENDNLYREKLDAFQMEWWATFRPFIEPNASVYIWGNAEDLWRLWYSGGLKKSERLTFRNQIIWNKQHGQGMSSEDFRMYPTATEHCLFFMLGEQGFNNNADNYWDGWESIRAYLKTELQKVGDIKWAKRAAGHSEKSGCHWFDASQWTMPTEEVYKAWQDEANGKAFKREYDDLKREYDDLKREWYSTRAYFDNTHENMTDVWEYPRVQGEERHGHATPKPVDMISRIAKSSAPDGGLVIEPFLGSGTTLIACEKTGRVCYGMELSERYCDVILKRWEDFTGEKAVLHET